MATEEQIATNQTDFSDFDGMFDDLNIESSATEPAAVVQKQFTEEETVKVEKNMSPAESIATLQEAQTKLSQIKIEINNKFMERDTLVDLMMLALVSGSNLLMLGKPGTGKSLITQELCSRIDGGNYFQWMLNKTSDPSEILGSFSVKAMENDKFMRITTGKLPEAHIAFLDEVYKSNAPTLNALLTIMNEHIFYNDGKAVPIPLISLIGASNEPPEDESLDALHDRFILRIKLGYVKDVSNKKRMHVNYISERANKARLMMKTKLTLDEIKCLQDNAKNVGVSKNIINQFVRLIASLERQNVHPSDRRQNECFKIMQAAAVIRGAVEVGLDDFRHLIYVLWDKEEQIPIIEAEVLKMVNPYDNKFEEITRTFNEIKNGIENASSNTEKTEKIIEARGNIEKIVSKLNKVISDATSNGRDTNDFIAFRQNMIDYSRVLIENLMNIDGSNGEVDNASNSEFKF